MSFETIWSFVTSNAMELIALGVSSGVAIYTTLSSIGLEKQKSKLQKQIDRANSLNERVTHIQNNQFDYKFEIFKQLSETSFRMCHYFCIYLQCVIMKNPFDYVTEQEYMSKVEIGCYEYRDMIYKYAPFIPEDLYVQFDDLLSMGFKFVNTLVDNRKNGFAKDVGEINDDYQKIAKKHKELAKVMREYLDKLARGEDDV